MHAVLLGGRCLGRRVSLQQIGAFDFAAAVFARGPKKGKEKVKKTIVSCIFFPIYSDASLQELFHFII